MDVLRVPRHTQNEVAWAAGLPACEPDRFLRAASRRQSVPAPRALPGHLPRRTCRACGAAARRCSCRRCSSRRRVSRRRRTRFSRCGFWAKRHTSRTVHHFAGFLGPRHWLSTMRAFAYSSITATACCSTTTRYSRAEVRLTLQLATTRWQASCRPISSRRRHTRRRAARRRCRPHVRACRTALAARAARIRRCAAAARDNTWSGSLPLLLLLLLCPLTHLDYTCEYEIDPTVQRNRWSGP